MSGGSISRWAGHCSGIRGPDTSTVNAVLTFADATGLEAKDNPGVTIDGNGNLRVAARVDANEWKPYSGTSVAVNASAVVGSGAFQSSRNLMLQVKGSDQSSTAGPNVGLLDADGYPSLELFHWDHDNVAVLFDAWHDSGFKSSYGSGTNAAIRKVTNSCSSSGRPASPKAAPSRGRAPPRSTSRAEPSGSTTPPCPAPRCT